MNQSVKTTIFCTFFKTFSHKELSFSILDSELLRRCQHSDQCCVTQSPLNPSLHVSAVCSWSSLRSWVSAYLQNPNRSRRKRVGKCTEPIKPLWWLFPCLGSSEKLSPIWPMNRSLLFPALRCFSTGPLTRKILTQGFHIYVVVCTLEGHFHAAWPH